MYFLEMIPFWVWIVISSIFFGLGEFLSKKFALNPGWALFLTFLIVDTISASAWIPAIFEKSQLSTTGVIWSIVSLLATVTIGVLAFNEKLTLIQSAGIVMGLISVTLLSL